jgi:hypothetical protein
VSERVSERVTRYGERACQVMRRYGKREKRVESNKTKEKGSIGERDAGFHRRIIYPRKTIYYYLWFRHQSPFIILFNTFFG